MRQQNVKQKKSSVNKFKSEKIIAEKNAITQLLKNILK